MVLDDNVSYTADGATYTKALRYDYADRSGLGDYCTSYTISNILYFTPQTEVWVELYYSFAANFTTVAPGCSGLSNPDLKFLFLGTEAEDRWGLYIGVGGGQWQASYPGALISNVASTVEFDGAWHRVRWHAKVSTTISSGDGAFELWLDATKVVDLRGINTVHTNGTAVISIPYLTLGANLNQGPDHAMSRWYGRLRIFKTNPGWV
jgi:hypothetical protein